MNWELQFFKKRMQYPVFWGGTFMFSFPLNDSKYGFTPSKQYQLSLMAMSSSLPFKKIKWGKLSISSVGLTFAIAHAGRSEWKGQGETPNSKSILYVPGVNILFGLEDGGGFARGLRPSPIYSDARGSPASCASSSLFFCCSRFAAFCALVFPTILRTWCRICHQ